MKQKKIQEQENQNIIIYYANDLARKNNQFTLEEEKALHLIFSHIKPFEKNETIFKILKQDFFKKLGLSGSGKYKRYEKITDNLISKSLTKIQTDKDTNKGVIIYNVKWLPKEPFFEVSLNPNFMPYLEQLIDHYTKLNFNNIVKFQAKHTLTFYKFICSWTNEKIIENSRYIPTKELKELFGLSIDDYVYNGKIKIQIELLVLKKIITMVRLKIMNLLEN